MGRGGARPGAGRPKSALTKRTQEITTRVLAAGRTPLEVMLAVMEHFFAAGEYEKAVEVASRAAPFIHPKLATIDSRGRDVKPNAEIHDRQHDEEAAGVYMFLSIDGAR